jgi:pimeloyl-ACP methyl ester carboxylesterase
MSPLSTPASKIHLLTPPEAGKKAAQRTYIIYFLTGNPGLIEYYRVFLTHLYGLLTRDGASNRDVEFQVYGRSLSGFEMNSAEIKTHKYRGDPPYGLQDQIRHAEDDVVELVEEVKDQGGKDVRVILVGHSVGSYIGLEIVRRLRAHGVAGDDFDTRIAGVVGLFPTVVDIARSESGMKAAVSCLSLSELLDSAKSYDIAVLEAFVLCAHCIADCGIHHNVDAGSFSSEDCHCNHGIPGRCCTYHGLICQITTWRSTSTAHGAR